MATLPYVEPPQQAAVRPSSGIGLLMLSGSPFGPVYANVEAVQILTYPEDPAKIIALDRFIAGKIETILGDRRGDSRPHELWPPAEFVSGRRHYVSRAFSLQSSAGTTPRQPAVAVLLERGGFDLDGSRVAEQFHLTKRERETVVFLSLGLTNKDIANRMNVSPHTVKAFVKTIMFKTGALTRSGIVGRCSAQHLSS